MAETTRPHTVKRKQWRNLLALSIVALLILLGLGALLKEQRVPVAGEKGRPVAAPFATPLRQVDAQSVWLERAQGQLEQEAKKSDGLKQQLELLQQLKEEQDKASAQQGQALQWLQQQVEALQKQLAGQKTSVATGQTERRTISDLALPLANSGQAEGPAPERNTGNFVPAGAFARAIALGGAEAPAGVTSQGEPVPMLFRFLTDGKLPNGHAGQLKGCVATAAAVGDISSERGAIRLERLSCVRPSGEVIELPVEAAVFGPDGKGGVRGKPVWREGALLQRSFAAGALSGIANGITQNYATVTPNLLGGTNKAIAGDKMLQYGLASGASSAADKLAEYHVRRAEQYHPIIQVSAGTVVDVVFIKGFYWDGRTESPTNVAAPAAPALEVAAPEAAAPAALPAPEGATAMPAATLPAPLPLTPRQVELLQQKNAQQGYF